MNSLQNHQNCRVVELDYRDNDGTLAPVPHVTRFFWSRVFIKFYVATHSYDIPFYPRCRTSFASVQLKSCAKLINTMNPFASPTRSELLASQAAGSRLQLVLWSRSSETASTVVSVTPTLPAW
ncbi:hypothetical protein M407DRAFT_31989 [Tulasnella calospora MUT 4182]|uniref:Uncharacterized protein n=1 Tax=Tulasnella calospora MUT 4182 TaxID=1051891 RepID=A0A0C3Q5J4_9AGAM|nr:hypothetical protein M407DRAFT_31989 [Tulasnella calospora MUT 4182]